MSACPLKEELSRLQGTWQAVAVEVDGEPVAEHIFNQSRLVIAGCRFDLCNPIPDAEEILHGTFTLDHSRTPKELDILLDDGTLLREIYEATASSLRIGYYLKGDMRPIDFKGELGSGLVAVVYRRSS